MAGTRSVRRKVTLRFVRFISFTGRRALVGFLMRHLSVVAPYAPGSFNQVMPYSLIMLLTSSRRLELNPIKRSVLMRHAEIMRITEMFVVGIDDFDLNLPLPRPTVVGLKM